jgi:hypothetical protein
MNGPMLQHGFITGRHIWVAMTVAIVLALGSQAAAAKECHRETPLPTDVRLIAPGPHAFQGTVTVHALTLFRARAAARVHSALRGQPSAAKPCLRY